ncbi:MAG: CD225/dispanin family protein [Prevotellaceae bacterium]|jgi:hypothetical protein|nr:CD225/dispanin family protein [Prevotellaceae bacterium]
MALITCKECGAQISEFAEVCPSCGAPTSISKTPPKEENTQQAYQQPQQAGYTQNPELPPKSWLVESILVTILCCLPFGIVGIVNASKVESRWYAGDKAGAKRASEEAGRWTKIGFFSGLAFAFIYVLLVVLGAFNGFWDGYSHYY